MAMRVLVGDIKSYCSSNIAVKVAGSAATVNELPAALMPLGLNIGSRQILGLRLRNGHPRPLIKY
jgi:hypothetical protein